MTTEKKPVIVKGKIANAITSAAKNHIVATTDDIYDDEFMEYQNEINKKLEEEVKSIFTSDFAKEDTLTEGVAAIRNDISEISLDTSDFAKEDTLTEGVAAIRNDISEISLDTSDLAKEDTLTEGVAAIRNDISEISLDTSDLAKEDTLTEGVSRIIESMPSCPTVQQIQNGLATELNATSNKTSIIEAINGAKPDLTPIAKEQTLETGVSVIRGDISNLPRVEQIQSGLAKEDTLVSGMTELSSAIGNISMETENVAKQGTNTGATNTAIYERLGNMVLMTEDEYTPAINDLLSRLN